MFALFSLINAFLMKTSLLELHKPFHVEISEISIFLHLRYVLPSNLIVHIQMRVDVLEDFSDGALNFVQIQIGQFILF